ncbi:MAG: hypothetical protein ACRD0G_17535 [Acidimicrobiales bacterium]
MSAGVGEDTGVSVGGVTVGTPPATEGDVDLVVDLPILPPINLGL